MHFVGCVTYNAPKISETPTTSLIFLALESSIYDFLTNGMFYFD